MSNDYIVLALIVQMIKKTFDRFKTLSKEIKSMIYLFWIYDFSQIIISIFINIFVFLETKSLLSLAIYNLIYFSAVFIGFSIWGYFMSRFKVSMHLNFLKAFFLYFISFVFLFFSDKGFNELLIFSFLNGLALGMFWLTMHSYEMINTSDNDRDFYSSMVSIGTETFSILSPLFATLTFYISEKILHIDTFYLLFLTLPFVYFVSIFFVFNLSNYTPKKINFSEMKNFFINKKIAAVRLYQFSGGFDWVIRGTLVSLVAIMSLGSVINVGIFETIMGIISISLVVFLSHKRHENNRVKIMFYATCVMSFAIFLLFFFDISPIFFVLFTLFFMASKPVFRVSEHVIDLKGVDLIQKEISEDFFPGLILRDVLIFLSRFIASLLIIFIYFLTGDEVLTLKILAIILPLFLIWHWWNAKRLMEIK